MASPPAAMVPCSAALASSNDKSMCRAAHTRACATCSAWRATTSRNRNTPQQHAQHKHKAFLHNALRQHDFLNNRHADAGHFFANASAHSTGKRALRLARLTFSWSISLHFCQLACFNMVLLIHVATVCCYCTVLCGDAAELPRKLFATCLDQKQSWTLRRPDRSAGPFRRSNRSQ